MNKETISIGEIVTVVSLTKGYGDPVPSGVINEEVRVMNTDTHHSYGPRYQCFHPDYGTWWYLADNLRRYPPFSPAQTELVNEILKVTQDLPEGDW